MMSHRQPALQDRTLFRLYFMDITWLRSTPGSCHWSCIISSFPRWKSYSTYIFITKNVSDKHCDIHTPKTDEKGGQSPWIHACMHAKQLQLVHIFRFHQSIFRFCRGAYYLSNLGHVDIDKPSVLTMADTEKTKQTNKLRFFQLSFSFCSIHYSVCKYL